MTQVGNRLTDDQFNKISAPFQMDMVAFYNLLLEDIVKKLGDAENEGKTPDEFIQDIQELFV